VLKRKANGSHSAVVVSSVVPLPRLLAASVALIAALVGSTARSESVIEQVGVGASMAVPAGGPSLLLGFDERFSTAITVGSLFHRPPAVQVQVNYRREGSRGGYWLFGAGTDDLYYLGRVGYGFAWQRGPLRFHLEASLNLPQLIGDGNDQWFTGLDYILPLGLGVHYVFGQN